MTQYRRGGEKKPRIEPAPTYDIVGWVTEAEGAEIRNLVAPANRGGSVQRSTISRWRTQGYMQAFDINGILTVVNVQQLMEFEELKRGRGSEPPDPQEDLPEYITIVLKRRKGPEPPKKHRGEPKVSATGKPKPV